MSENSWVLKGVDPDAKQRTEAEAARLGVSVADYLTDLVVRQAVIDQLVSAAEGEQSPPEADDALIFAPPPESSEGFAIRQRLKALERRLGTAVGSLDGALAALDTSLFDITARVGDVEALAGDSAHALGQTQQEMNNALAGLQIHLAVIEDNLTAQAQAQQQQSFGLERRIENVERDASILADAHEALKHAVAEDFTAFTNETADRLNASLADVRAAADAAADHADAAVAHLVSELRTLRGSIEQRLEESADETRARMHAAFADAAERMAALAERVSDNERFTARTADQLRAQLTDIEDGAQVALEETANVLREADASLAAKLDRASREHYAALEAVRGDLGAQVATLREDQLTQTARLKLIDVAVDNTIKGMDVLRSDIEQQTHALTRLVSAAQQDATEQWDRRFDAVASRLQHQEQNAETLQQRLSSELDRIEACTFAALEKLRRDIGAGDAAAAQQLDAGLRQLRDEHAGALARLTLLDTAVTRLEGASITTNGRIEELESASRTPDPELERRLGQLEHAVANAQSEQAIAILSTDLAALKQQLDAQETARTALDEGLQGVARMLNRVAAQSVETAERADQRLHQTELALADLRIEMLSQADANNLAPTLQTLQERMTAFELRQTNALETLRADIARFVADNDRRFEALETLSPAGDSRDLAGEFESLRSRIEERVLGVELRSVRTLEQVVDTVALLEQRLLGASEPDDEAAKTA